MSLNKGTSKKASYQNADCLIRCMKQKKFLINTIKDMGMYPRFNKENIEFLNIQFQENSLTELYIPMLCFCDIPLKYLNQHNKIYGDYAIALKKEWGEKNKIAPVHYLYNDSDVFDEFRSLFLFANEFEKKSTDQRVYSYLFNRLFFTKPKSGLETIQTRDNETGKSTEITIEKLYTDEQEHRYVPNLHRINTKIKQFYTNKDNIPLDDLSNSLTSYRQYKLTFTVSDIKHIILKSNIEKQEIIEAIMNSPNIDKLDDKYDAISKIVTLEEIEEDF
ncbi:abortive infection system antitoxin AbiGi family protein [Staphylococcus nepalensis]|uniref:abortive infection system antitoxin AbiGi family protein n=1 Tax=Staphylococcus nepalensis TaxID=214473 RepID=UPI0031BB6AA5